MDIGALFDVMGHGMGLVFAAIGGAVSVFWNGTADAYSMVGANLSSMVVAIDDIWEASVITIVTGVVTEISTEIPLILEEVIRGLYDMGLAAVLELL